MNIAPALFAHSPAQHLAILPPTGEHENVLLPVVQIHEGHAVTTSIEVARVFEKQHKNVLQSIQSLLAQLPDANRLNFQPVKYTDGKGESRPAFQMTRDGFTLLAMGFTGNRALSFKLAFIDAFNRMEAQLKAQASFDPHAFFNDPVAMRGALLTYTERVIALEAKVEEQAPKIEALNRIASSDGSLCMRDSAKVLQIRPIDLKNWLLMNRWIYGRPGHSGWLGYQDKIQAGLLCHKVHTKVESDGNERTFEQVRITSKGLTRIGESLSRLAA